MKKYTHFIFGLLILVSCNSNSSTTLESFDVENKEKRIEILSKQIKVYSTILDTEFSLFNANGFESKFVFNPANFSSSYKIALQIDKTNLDKWLLGMYNSENENSQDSVWINSILDKLDAKRKENWIQKMQESNPKRFTISATNGRTKVAIIYQNDKTNEVIIFERTEQN